MKKLIGIILVIVGLMWACGNSNEPTTMENTNQPRVVEGELVLHKATKDTLVITDWDRYSDDPDKRYWIRVPHTYEEELVERRELIFLEKNVEDMKTTTDVLWD